MIEGFGTNNGPADISQCIDIDAIDVPVESPAEGQPRSVPRFEKRVGPARMGEISINRM
jgi:hypothetical protein